MKTKVTMLDSLGISVTIEDIITPGQRTAMNEIERRLGAPWFRRHAYRLLFPSYWKADGEIYDLLRNEWQQAILNETFRQGEKRIKELEVQDE